MNPRLKTAIPNEDYTLDLVFENGETGAYDCSDLIGFGIFSELKDINYFKQVAVAFGTVTWPHGQDICPDTLYLTATGKTDQLMVAEEGTEYGKPKSDN
jgi:hypothetical protein